MKPIYSDGQVVFIKKDNNVFNGKTLLAKYNGKIYLTKLFQDSSGTFLNSINGDNKKMPINDEHPLKIYGIVL